MAEERPRPVRLAGTRLSTPLSELSKLELDERATRRMWRVIERRLDAAERARSGRVRVELRWLVAALGLVLVGMLGVAVWQRSPSRSEPGSLAATGPLLTRDGEPFEGLDAADTGGPRRLELADGSSIEAAPGARIEALASTSSEFAVLLRRGRARFSVTPHGPRRWSIETRGARVEVVGTVLSVAREGDRLEVDVDEGIVLVRSAFLPDGVQRLVAGQSVQLELPEPLREERVPRDAVTPVPAESDSSRETPREQARARESRPVTAAAPSSEAATRLWNAADTARRDGDGARAAQILQQLLEEHPSDPRAPLGAFTLGLLELEQLGRPAAAARSFRRALELGIPAGLEEACYLRLAEASRRAGAGAGLRDAGRPPPRRVR